MFTIYWSLNDDIPLLFDPNWLANMFTFTARVIITFDNFLVLLVKFLRFSSSGDKEVDLVLHQTSFNDILNQLLLDISHLDIGFVFEVSFSILESSLEVSEFLFHVTVPMILDIIVSSSWESPRYDSPLVSV